MSFSLLQYARGRNVQQQSLVVAAGERLVLPSRGDAAMTGSPRRCHKLTNRSNYGFATGRRLWSAKAWETDHEVGRARAELKYRGSLRARWWWIRWWRARRRIRIESVRTWWRHSIAQRSFGLEPGRHPGHRDLHRYRDGVWHQSAEHPDGRQRHDLAIRQFADDAAAQRG